MNGCLFNNDNGLYYRCLNTYKITLKDGSFKVVKARCKSDASDYIEDYDQIMRIEEIEQND